MAFKGFLINGKFQKEPPPEIIMKLKQVILDEFGLMEKVPEKEEQKQEPDDTPAA